ncbi:MAG: polymerase III subunit alpha protein [Microgenomates group bacterium GW2011_GWA2_44_7]|nr:MAG: polymerase III subunit alpha protein [Microgenomates group bacterium GW2011_GWA2_44_7]
MGKFIHLHVHSEYSLLDGLSKTREIVRRVKELGMSSVALTDHGSMSGAVEFYKNAVKEEIKPILGVEAYITNRDHRIKESRSESGSHHLVLLAKNNEGYRNLMELTTIAHLEGYYYKPRFDKDTFTKHTKGIVASSACMKGEIASLLIEGEYDKAKETARWFSQLLGEDNYYLEVQRHQYEEYASKTEDHTIKGLLKRVAENEKKVVEGVVKLSRELGLPMITTSDAHYVSPEAAVAQDVLVCVATGKNVSDINRMRYVDAPTFYLHSTQEMTDLFPEIPEAIENTSKIAERCEVTLSLDKWYFPEFPIDQGKTYPEVLTEKANEGARAIFQTVPVEVQERLDYELKTINQKGYAPYFLIVSDISRWCFEHGIITNTRGSAAGSLVSYVLGITTINPLNYELPFERFLTPWRPSPPDIDFDIADDRREEVITYIIGKYGPLGSQGFPMTIDRALETTPDLKALYDKDIDAKKVIDLAKQIEGNARHVSVHAAGVVIAPTKLTEFTPLQLDPDGAKVITQYDMDALDPNVSPKEAIGLLKFDLLGIRNLAILGRAVEIAKQTTGKDIDLGKLPLDDKKTFTMLAKGETMGTFQLGGSGMTRYLKELKPTRIEDLMAMVALFRPGPMSIIPDYIARKHNPSQVKYLDIRMKEYLGKSLGLLVYQDDVFMTAIKIAGYSWEEADKFRKAIGKKIPAEMAKQKDKFVKGCIENGMNEAKANELFGLIEPFAAYGFGKAHAASYGIIAYQTSYMKANFPVEFMTALMTAESGDTEKIAEAIGESRRMGIIVMPPDINTSKIGFTIENNEKSLSSKAIRFGLSAIKNVGEAAISAILFARDKSGAFLSLTDFCRRVDGQKVNRKVLESLIKTGALDKFGKRAAMLASIDKIRDRAGKNSQNDNQGSLFGVDEKSNLPGQVDDLEMVSEFDKPELLALEKELLGFYLTEHPLSGVLNVISDLTTHKLAQILPEENVGKNVKVGGIISEIRVVVTKNSGQEMIFAKLEDDTGSIGIIVFPKLYSGSREHWVKDKIIIIEGKIDQREEELSVIVDRVIPFDKSNPTLAKNESEESFDDNKSDTVIDKIIEVKIPKGTSPLSLVKLNSLLQVNRGGQNVTLSFENGKGEKRMVLPFGVNWSSSLQKEVDRILNDKK